MIKLSFTTAFMLYLGITLAIVLGIWIYSHYRTRRQIVISNEKALFVCEFCHFAYLEENARELNRCPQCGLFNKQNHFQNLQSQK